MGGRDIGQPHAWLEKPELLWIGVSIPMGPSVFKTYQQPWLLIFFIAQDEAIRRVRPHKFIHILHDKRGQGYT